MRERKAGRKREKRERERDEGEPRCKDNKTNNRPKIEREKRESS